MRSIWAVALALSACSFGMKTVDPQWDGTSEPECDNSVAPVVVDGLVSGGLLAVALEASNPSSSSDGLVIAGLAGGLVFAISSIVGERNYKRCDEAMETWRIGGAIAGGTSERAAREAKEYEGRHRAELAIEAAERARHQEVPQTAEAPKPSDVPRGYFCSSSDAVPAAGSCAREKAECQRTRDAAVIGVPDLSGCALQETAWCTAERCVPSEAACEARRERAGSDAMSCHEEE